MKLVLDTNVVLDWLLFEDPAAQLLSAAIQERRVSLVVHAHALEELQRVLQYPRFALDADRRQQIFLQYEQVADLFTATVAGDALPPAFPRCRDPDDDPFVALAYLVGADALVSKDRRVLGMRKRLRKFGLAVLTPRQLKL